MRKDAGMTALLYARWQRLQYLSLYRLRDNVGERKKPDGEMKTYANKGS